MAHTQDLRSFLEVLHLAENLKKELRHSWLSSGRQESVAEHTWRISLMAIFLVPLLKQEVNMEKLLKMITIHDLAEAIAGDIPAFAAEAIKRNKYVNEREAILVMKDKLPPQIGEELFVLWQEYEEKTSFEAKVANALDKLEVQIQHNEADLSTWLEIEHEMSFLLDRHVEFEPVLRDFKNLIEKEAEIKLVQAGIDVESIKGRIK